MESLPNNIEEACNTIATFSDKLDRKQEIRLRIAALSFSMAVLKAVRQMTCWFDKRLYRTHYIPTTRMRNGSELITLQANL